MQFIRNLLATLLLAGAAHAQTLKPVVSCPDLRSLTSYQMSVATAVVIPASADAPEHCRVSGQVLPQVGFEVNLPAEWNGRLYMFGNGGYAGEPFEGPGRSAPRNRALKHGYATAATDTGHQASLEPLGTFAADRQRLLDYAFRSLHVTAESAKSIAGRYYGSGPKRSYYEGCSTGGRQGLILAQRFPDDFDGLVIGAPVLNFTGTMAGYANSLKALAAGPIPAAKLPLLAERVYAKCDDVDGLKDGLIDDPRQCRFDPAADLPRCDAGDGAACFTPRQIDALRTIYSEVTSKGQRIFPGWPVGAEVLVNARSGWDGWIIRDGGQPTWAAFSETFFRYLAPPKPDPQYDLSTFDVNRDMERLGPIHQILDATDTDLTRLQKRGGKILMYFGWADSALNPLMGLEYYQKVAERMGPDTTNFYRLFMVPGMFHCSGGAGTDTFEKLDPLVEWVENGKAPAAIPASRVVDGKTVRTRPLCPYPEVARYKGSGSIDDASNFACARP